MSYFQVEALNGTMTSPRTLLCQRQRVTSSAPNLPFRHPSILLPAAAAPEHGAQLASRGALLQVLHHTRQHRQLLSHAPHRLGHGAGR